MSAIVHTLDLHKELAGALGVDPSTRMSVMLGQVARLATPAAASPPRPRTLAELAELAGELHEQFITFQGDPDNIPGCDSSVSPADLERGRELAVEMFHLCHRLNAEGIIPAPGAMITSESANPFYVALVKMVDANKAFEDAAGGCKDYSDAKDLFLQSVELFAELECNLSTFTRVWLQETISKGRRKPTRIPVTAAQG